MKKYTLSRWMEQQSSCTCRSSWKSGEVQLPGGHFHFTRDWGLSFSLLHIIWESLACGFALFLFSFPAIWGFSATYLALIIFFFHLFLKKFIWKVKINLHNQLLLWARSLLLFLSFNPSKILISFKKYILLCWSQHWVSQVTYSNNAVN